MGLFYSIVSWADAGLFVRNVLPARSIAATNANGADPVPHTVPGRVLDRRPLLPLDRRRAPQLPASAPAPGTLPTESISLCFLVNCEIHDYAGNGDGV